MDFGTKVEAPSKADIYKALDFDSNEEMIKANGGVMPDIYEISEDEYEEDDGYDVA